MGYVPKLRLTFQVRGDDDSMFMGWLNQNKVNSLAKNLTYAEIPGYFTWSQSGKRFKGKRRGFEVGRIGHVPREIGEFFFLRILLVLDIVRGPTCDEDLRSYEGVVYETYRKACSARGILEG